MGVARLAPGARPPSPVSAARRWWARGSLFVVVLAVLAPLLLAGLRSLVAVVVIGAVAAAVVVAALWGALTHRGLLRTAGAVVAALALLGVAVLFAFAHVWWIIVLSLGLWAVAAAMARTALTGTESRMREYAGPPPRRPFVVMNPRSGGGKVARFDLVARAEALGARVVLLDPDHPVDVAALAREAVAGGADLLGVAGGDGTQALVAGVAAEHDVPLLVISAGTRNHFALDLGLDREDPSRCLDALTDGVELRVDLGVVNGRPFVNNASFGAYATLVQSPEYRADKAQTALRELPDLLLGHSGARLTATAGPVRIEAPQAVLVSNNPYGSGDLAGAGRRTRLDGGTLGVLGVRVETALQAAALVRGRAGDRVTVVTASEATVAADAGEIPVGVDGEALMLRTPVRCAIVPGALRVLVPRDRPGRAGRPRLDWARVRGLASGVAGGLVRTADHRTARPAAGSEVAPPAPPAPPEVLEVLPSPRPEVVPAVPALPRRGFASRRLDELSALDRAVYRAVAATHTPSLDAAFARLSTAANHSKLWLGTAAVLAVAGGRTGRRAALLGVASVGVTSAVNNLLVKPLLRRRRPDRATAAVPEARWVRMPASRSFPSGHAASAFAFATTVGAVIPTLSLPLHVAAVAVAYSRVHTGVHYPGDTIAGALLGTAVTGAIRHNARAGEIYLDCGNPGLRRARLGRYTRNPGRSRCSHDLGETP